MMPMPQYGQQQFPNAYAAMMQRPPFMGGPPQWQPPWQPPVAPPQPVQGPIASPVQPADPDQSQQPQPPMWGANPPRMYPLQAMPGQADGMQPPQQQANNFAGMSNLRRPFMMPQ